MLALPMKNPNAIPGAIAAALLGCGGEPSLPSSQLPAPGPTPAALTVFMGDSITYYWDSPAVTSAPELLRTRLAAYADVGIGGQTSVDMAARFATDVLARHPGAIVIDAGTNDVYLHASADMSALFAMVESGEAAGARVIVGTLPPDTYDSPDAAHRALHAQWNAAILAGGAQYGYIVADYYSAMVRPDGSQDPALFRDGVHPNDAGYAVMWSVLAPLL